MHAYSHAKALQPHYHVSCIHKVWAEDVHTVLLQDLLVLPLLLKNWCRCCHFSPNPWAKWKFGPPHPRPLPLRRVGVCLNMSKIDRSWKAFYMKFTCRENTDTEELGTEATLHGVHKGRLSSSWPQRVHVIMSICQSPDACNNRQLLFIMHSLTLLLLTWPCHRIKKGNGQYCPQQRCSHPQRRWCARTGTLFAHHLLWGRFAPHLGWGMSGVIPKIVF